MPLLLAAPFALAALPAAAQAGSTSFRSPGCDTTWTVPAGVTQATFDVQGGQGAAGGGRGALVSAVLDVTPGNTMYICVDVGGGAGAVTDGGKGGGYSSVSDAPVDAGLRMVAGGGGGGGGAIGIGVGNQGSGGDAGTTGDSRTGGSSGTANGGRPATASPPDWGSGGGNVADNTTRGDDGGPFFGGDGGIGASADGQTSAGGGGGGGGYMGGGGGAGAASGGWNSAAAGGGGGTSFCSSPTCSAVLGNGDAYVTISWSDPLPQETTTVASLNRPIPLSQQTVTYQAAVTPAPSGGTVQFRVDGVTVNGCESKPVDTTTGLAECETWLPGPRGDYTLTTSYSGTTGFRASSDDLGFHVRAGAITATPTPAALFGEVALGGSTTQQITVSNSGDAAVEIEAIHGIRISEYLPEEADPASPDYSAADDQCSGRTLVPGASCVVTVAFRPSALGERLGQFRVSSDAWSGSGRVKLIGTGIAARQPETREPETPITPENPTTPETPSTPSTPTPPAAPQTPSAPAPAPPKPPTPTPLRPIGASSPISPTRGAPLTPAGDLRLPLVCPPGQPCRVSGELTLAISGGQARAAATTRVLVRFSGIKVAAGKTKTLSLKLPASFVKAQQKKGVRKLRTTLTVNTTLGDGTRITRRQAVTLLIPRASVAQRAAPRPADRPSFTG